MKAMIMAAGVGSRLMPLTMYKPKPMMPMCNRPLMELTVELLYQHNFKEIICNLHHHPEIISSHFASPHKFPWPLQYSYEAELLGTAGGVKKCEWFLDDTFVVISGDALTDIDLTGLLRVHRAQGALATIAVKDVDEVEQFGVVISDDQGRILKFQEKPRREEALSKQVNTGIYIFEPEIFKYIPPDQFYDFGKQVFPHLVKRQAPFYAANINGYWCDIGNIQTYRQAHYDILAHAVNVTPSGQLLQIDRAQVLLGSNSQVDVGVSFKGQVIIGPQCHIAAGVSLENCIIWEKTRIKADSYLHDCIVGADCEIGNNCVISANAVVASGCILPDQTEIAAEQNNLPQI